MAMFLLSRFALLACMVLLVTTTEAATTDTLKIGVVASLTGASAEGGKDTILGAQLAADEVNRAGGVLGKRLELVIEDDQTTDPGATLAFNKLAALPEIHAFLSPQRSGSIRTIATDVKRVGRPMMIGGSDPRLTHMENPWFFRCRPNDSYSARVIAEFGVNTLGKCKWAVVHAGDAFGTSGRDALVGNLKKLGVEPVTVQSFPNEAKDFTSIVTAVKTSGADLIGSYVNLDDDQITLARQMREQGVALPWVGSAAIVGTRAVERAGPALHGTYGVTDFTAESGPVAAAFATKFNAVAGRLPDDQAAWAYDAVNLLALSIRNANSTAPDAIRTAILAIRGYEGAEGIYNFDQNGDGLHGYNLVRNDNGTVVFERHIEFKD